MGADRLEVNRPQGAATRLRRFSAFIALVHYSFSSKGSAVSRGALMQGVNFYASVIAGTVPPDSGSCTDKA
jgi:hypothetical protein